MTVMAEKNNAVCSICGKGYYMCISCKDTMRLHPWKIYTDTSEHYKIFQIIRGYSTKVYDIKEAQEKLKNVDLSDLEEFNDNIKATIKKILEYKDESVTDTFSTKKSTSNKSKITKPQKTSMNSVIN